MKNDRQEFQIPTGGLRLEKLPREGRPRFLCKFWCPFSQFLMTLRRTESLQKLLFRISLRRTISEQVQSDLNLCAIG